ncbi:hypothetical protein L6164_035594 [Bauhinia variegata]|uniref:Uncharacterized protein n=1 Tax=Bauhinia variegata TaxID=167791 RepID=A0ACB9KEG0_BAUVA|nr:hypothetical protein L6164_035594 [Bauhinia variegata]
MEAYKKVLVVGLVLTIAIVGLEPILADGFSSTFCGMTIEELQECESAVKKENAALPTEKCCSGIKDADFKCLCDNEGMAALYGVDIGKAMELPGKCGIKKKYKCN